MARKQQLQRLGALQERCSSQDMHAGVTLEHGGVCWEYAGASRISPEGLPEGQKLAIRPEMSPKARQVSPEGLPERQKLARRPEMSPKARQDVESPSRLKNPAKNPKALE